MRSAIEWIRRGGYRLLLGLAGATVVVVLGDSLGWHRIGERVREVGFGFAWVLAAYLLANLFFALPLGLVLPTRPSLRALVASRLAAVSINSATPFLGVGGEPVRLLWLPACERRSGIAALVIDRSAFLGASALFLSTGAAVGAASPSLPPSLRIALPSLAGLALASVGGLYLCQRGGGVAGPMARMVGRFSSRFGSRLSDGAGQIDRGVRGLHEANPMRFPIAVAGHLAGRFAGAVEVAVIARLLGLSLGAGGTLLFATLPLAVDLVFSFVPSQIGIHEGSSALLASALGLDPAAGVAMAFVQRMRQIVFITLGFLLLAARRRAPDQAPSSGANSSPSAR